MTRVATLFESALQAHRNGQRDEARRLYTEVLQCEPRHADALHLSGLLYLHAGQPDQAIDFLRRAIAVDPTQAVFLANLAEAHRGLGQLTEAIECYTQSLRLDPHSFDAHNNLGTLFQTNAQLDEAVACYNRALKLEPQSVDCLFNLATALHRQGKLHAAGECFERILKWKPDHLRALINLGGILMMERRLDAAQQCYERAIRIDPGCGPLYYNLGNVYLGQDRRDKAIPAYRRALELEPNYVDALCNLGSALQDERQYEPAIECLERAIQLRPNSVVAYCNLGVAYQDLGRLAESRRCYVRALELEPWRAEFVYNLGTILRDQGEISDALERFDQVLRMQPKHAKALCSRGTTLLSIGDFRQGFAGYEYRVGLPEYNTRSFPQPKWDGKPLGERTLLVHCEQGYGDTLQFIRYCKLIEDRGTHIVVATNRELIPLLTQSGVDGLVPNNEPPPPFDMHAPLLSLPHILGTELDTVPRAVPYLSADPELVDRWRTELAGYPGLKIGVVWQGRANFRGDRMRSMTLACLAPLVELPGVRLFSLQKGVGSEQLEEYGEPLHVVDFGRRLDNDGAAFVDTAAVIENLDLVITTDTAMAHLAGALGARVWVALSLVPDWRWMLTGGESPWYPTMRLFRQTILGEWTDVVEHMTVEIAELQRD